jgi:ribosomal protein L16 Arg81 hydroxylase
MGTDRSTIARVIAPISTETFFAEYFERKPMLVKRGEPHYHDALLTLDALDHVITTYQLFHPDINLANAARDIQTRDYTFQSGQIDVARLYKQFADGATIICNQLERFHTPLGDMCRGLERDLSTRFQANIYLTPQEAQGLRTHYDSHDVFVMQIHGIKHWKIYDTPIELPFRGQGFTDNRVEPGNVTMEFDLEPGDVLYMPRGVMHDTRTSTRDSLHITVGVLFTSWTELLLEAVARVALTDPEFRRSLPPGFARPGFDRTGAQAQFHKLLARIAERADFHASLDHFADDLVTSRLGLLEGQLGMVRRLDSITADTVAGVRPNLLYRIRESETHVTVSSYTGEISLPRHAGDTLRGALESERFVVRELPGDLDDAGKVVLVRRLVREGLARLL